MNYSNPQTGRRRNKTIIETEKETNCFIPPTQEAISRPLVIDGCNIGRSASGYARTHVDCAGLVSVVRWLLMRKFDVTVFLPVVYNNINNYNSKNAELLTKLEQLGIVTFTPARSGRGLRKAFINYDDLYVVSYAARHGGTILSGDKFKDILNQSCYNDFHNVIRNRTVDVRFRPLTLDFVEYKSDKFYRHAPELFTYDHSANRCESLRQRLYALPHEPDYSIVKNLKQQVTDEKRELLCAELETILLSMSYAAGKMFREVTELPCMDNGFHGLRIEDVAPKPFADAFYQKFRNRDSKNEQNHEWVMEPVVEVIAQAKKTPEVIEDTVLTPTPLPLSNESTETVVAVKLPTDQSLGSLLQWFTMAEAANKNKK
ncbi:unnamed protein product [Caenorhabditis nigoni]